MTNTQKINFANDILLYAKNYRQLIHHLYEKTNSKDLSQDYKDFAMFILGTIYACLLENMTIKDGKINFKELDFFKNNYN